MKIIFNYLMLLSSTILFISCNDSATDSSTTKDSSNNMSQASAFDLSAVRSAIEEDGKKFVEDFKRGDSMAVAAHYSSDALAMPPNSEPVMGGGIVSLWGGAMKMGVKDLKLITDDVTGNDEIVSETGRFEMYGDNNKLLDKGKYVVVWKKENGAWKMYRDIWNSSMPAPH